MVEKDFETRSLELLADTQAALSSALESITINEADPFQRFKGHSCRYINVQADGYILLRSSGKRDASKTMIRPAIEAMLKILAVQKRPSALFQIAFKEHNDKSKTVNTIAKKRGVDTSAALKKQWNETVEAYKTKYPDHDLIEIEDKELSTKAAAVIAGLPEVYESQFRVYCNPTHGSYIAIMMPRMTDLLDNLTMTDCVLHALEAVLRTAKDIQRSRCAEELVKRRSELGQESSRRSGRS